jgi:cytochrome c553
VGGGRLIGPDLANVHLRRDEAWIIAFVQSSASLVKSGDADAVALFDEYNGLVMPDQALSDDDVRALIRFIAARSPTENASAGPVAAPVTPTDPTAERVQLGRKLFVGTERFENGASACSSCHTVNSYSVMTGGSLAINLTDAVSRLSRPGVDAMMASPPFPAMRAALYGKPLTDAERQAVGDFLQASGADQERVAATRYGIRLAAFGLVGLAILLGFFYLLGLRGTQKSVNQALYDRQISST